MSYSQNSNGSRVKWDGFQTPYPLHRSFKFRLPTCLLHHISNYSHSTFSLELTTLLRTIWSNIANLYSILCYHLFQYLLLSHIWFIIFLSKLYQYNITLHVLSCLAYPLYLIDFPYFKNIWHTFINWMKNEYVCL